MSALSWLRRLLPSPRAETATDAPEPTLTKPYRSPALVEAEKEARPLRDSSAGKPMGGATALAISTAYRGPTAGGGDGGSG